MPATPTVTVARSLGSPCGSQCPWHQRPPHCVYLLVPKTYFANRRRTRTGNPAKARTFSTKEQTAPCFTGPGRGAEVAMSMSLRCPAGPGVAFAAAAAEAAGGRHHRSAYHALRAAHARSSTHVSTMARARSLVFLAWCQGLGERACVRWVGPAGGPRRRYRGSSTMSWPWSWSWGHARVAAAGGRERRGLRYTACGDHGKLLALYMASVPDVHRKCSRKQ